MTINSEQNRAPRRSRKYWKSHVESWQASGGTQSHYCRQHNLSERLFSLWKNKFIKEQSSSEEDVAFIPVVTDEDKSAPELSLEPHQFRVVLPNGICLEVPSTSSGAQVAELTRHLVPLSC